MDGGAFLAQRARIVLLAENHDGYRSLCRLITAGRLRCEKGDAWVTWREVCEHALAHQLKDKAEAAYQRGTLFEKRRTLMNDWEKYCGKPSVAAAAVAPINRSN
jgi:DNA polymerase III alpha subunit